MRCHHQSKPYFCLPVSLILFYGPFRPLLNLDEIAGKSHGFLGHFQVTKGHSVHCH